MFLGIILLPSAVTIPAVSSNRSFHKTRGARSSNLWVLLYSVFDKTDSFHWLTDCSPMGVLDASSPPPAFSSRAATDTGLLLYNNFLTLRGHGLLLELGMDSGEVGLMGPTSLDGNVARYEHVYPQGGWGVPFSSSEHSVAMNRNHMMMLIFCPKTPGCIVLSSAFCYDDTQ